MKRAALKRTSSLRRSPMCPSKRRSKYARRERDFEYMGFVKALLCSVEEEWPNPDERPTECGGVIEADHMGARGLGQKADDRTCAPMCRDHHREHTDHTGTFKHVDRETERAWRERAIERTQVLFVERHGGNLA
jgi:hypothetical protein